MTTGESSSRRREVLRILRGSADPMSIVAIADVLEVHPNTVRFHLEILLGDGEVEQVEAGRKGPGRPPVMFRAVRQMDRGGTRRYRLLAAGRAWRLELDPMPASLVCTVHLGLMQGVMETLGAPITAERLEPLVEPDLCLVHLRPRPAAP